MRFPKSLAALLFSASLSTAAVGAVIDQSLTIEPGQDAGSIGIAASSSERYGQEFTPTFSSLDYAAAGLSASTDGAVFVANIYEGSLTGSLLGTSGSTTVPVGSYPNSIPELTGFLFDSPIALTPGEIYVLEIVALEGWASWTQAQTDFPSFNPSTGYEAGRSLVRSSTGTVYASGSLDFTFATGLQERSEAQPDGRVPEPGTALLLLLGVAGTACARRCRA